MLNKENKKTNSKIRGILKTIGPGILYAGAAIGASHLVLSTQAGAKYHFNLLWLLLLVNLFKYPFFEFSYRYTAATNKSMLDGYRKLGNWAIITFFILSFCTAIVNFAAVVKVTSDLAAYIFHIEYNSFAVSSSMLGMILLILFVGKFSMLDIIMKAMIVVLAIFTVSAFFFAMGQGTQIHEAFIPPEMWDNAGLAFIIAFMGWMPTPIDASVWPSLWALERNKHTCYKPTLKEYLVDFHIGYLGSTILAFFFLGLGAFIMYGTGKEFSPNGLIFSQQLISLYTESIGPWSTTIIAVIVFITMFSTALTVIDGYPRSLDVSIKELFPQFEKKDKKLYYFWTIFLSITTILIIGLFTKNMGTLLAFATILSFITAPIFAIINYKVVTGNFIPIEFKPKVWLKVLSWLGIIFLVGFNLVYIYTLI